MVCVSYHVLWVHCREGYLSKQLPVEEPQYDSDYLYNSRFHIYPLALHMFPLSSAVDRTLVSPGR
ncbi:hypothetical protein B0J17DRAFT_686701 [Rhizoctonia solani]|nr:hypothetical protein B0J17DRAFT_686701 [Rhizoctonia solani]